MRGVESISENMLIKVLHIRCGIVHTMDVYINKFLEVAKILFHLHRGDI